MVPATMPFRQRESGCAPLPAQLAAPFCKQAKSTGDNSKSLFELTMVSAASISEDYPGKHVFERQEKVMVAYTGIHTPLQNPRRTALALQPRCSHWMIWIALAISLAAGPALSQAGVQLIKVDLSVVAQGYRISKLIGSSVINDKNERIGTIDDIIADKDKKQLSFAVLQVGGFLGVGGHLVVVPYDSLVIDDNGRKITLPGATKDELKKLSGYNYPA
jgi:sporulation protein YlmC with PRC-barrel domain